MLASAEPLCLDSAHGAERRAQGASGGRVVGNTTAATAAGKAELFAEAHRRLLEQKAIQFDMQPVARPSPPAWLKPLGEFIGAISPLLQILFWAGVAALVVFLVLAIARRVEDGEWSWRRKKAAAPERAESWRPEEAPARALLREADALAAAGRYAEAVHLLLFRSIEEIDRRRPELVRPALTSRDIAGAPALPSGPKGAFATIVMAVERSLFGGRPVGETDWNSCRSAYQEFAFSGWKE